jgi:hypothetical protein
MMSETVSGAVRVDTITESPVQAGVVKGPEIGPGTYPMRSVIKEKVKISVQDQVQKQKMAPDQNSRRYFLIFVHITQGFCQRS